LLKYMENVLNSTCNWRLVLLQSMILYFVRDMASLCWFSMEMHHSR
jgi:hypothetical protein